MDIRNILHKKEEKKTKIFRIVIAIIFGISTLCVFWILVQKHNQKTEYFLWESVSVYGSLEVHNNYPINTHKIISSDGIFGIKSSSINFNDFLDEKISIIGNISEITKDFPVIDVSSITIPDKNVKVANNIYSFAKELIFLDFSQEKEFYASKNGNKITIYLQHEPVIEIEYFFCSKITPSHNCEELIENYENNDHEFFSSYWWNVFYRIENNKWITFNDNTLWYIINTTDEDLLLNLSHLLNIIDSNFISKNKKDLLIENCIWEIWEDESISISDLKMSILDENLIKLDIEFTNSIWETSSCKLNIDIFDNRNIKNIITQ